jgi:quinol monooxygenase YgiN
MNTWRAQWLLFGVTALLLVQGAQSLAQAPAQPSGVVNAVSYLEAMPSSRAATIAALDQYRDASRSEDGYVRFELLEQLGRRGHFAIVESWRDQQSFDSHAAAAAARQFQTALQPIRLAGYDQRPYKPLSAAAAKAGETDQAVYVVSHVDIGSPQSDAPGVLTRLAEASRMEAGCLRFDVLQHAMRGNHFTIIEVWQNQQALDAHAAAAHTRQYRDTIQPLIGSPLDERLYRSLG